MMVPVGRLVVLRTTAKADLLRAVATITWPGLAAPVLGPPVGGFITTYASWRWIFLLNVPLGLAALGCALWLIPNARGAGRRPFDALGFVLTGLACFGVMYGVDLMSGADVSWGRAAVLLGGALLLGAVAIRHARRSAHPLVELWAMRLRSYAVVMAGGSLFRISIGAIPFLLPLMLQLGFGLDPFASGLLVLAVFAGNLAMKPLTTPVLRRFGFRRTLIANGLITAAATFGCAFVEATTPVMLVAALLFVSGLSRSMQFTALGTLAFADVPSARMSGANTLFNMAQQMAMGMGIAIGAVSLRLAGVVHGHADALPAVADFHLAFAIVAGLALLGVADVIRLPADAGAEVSGGRVRTAGAEADMTVIYVDGDACPVRDEVFRVAERLALGVTVVSNGSRPIRPPNRPNVRMVTVAEGADAADDWIAERIGAADVCVTSDIPLAARCLGKAARALSPSGPCLDHGQYRQRARGAGGGPPSAGARGLAAAVRSRWPRRTGRAS